MKILIKGLRFPVYHKTDSKELAQVGKVGIISGNAYTGFKFIPDIKTHKFECYSLVHFNYEKLAD